MSWVVVQRKGTSPSPKPKAKTEKDEKGELQQLKLENFKLRTLLRECEGKLKSADGNVPPEVKTAASGLFKLLDSSAKKCGASPQHKAKSPTSEPSSAALEPSKASPFFASGAREPGSRSAIYVCKTAEPKEDEDSDAEGDGEAFVAVMDVNDEDWWEIVEPEKEDMEPVEEDDFHKDCSYIVVQQEELMDSISAFVAMALTPYPELKGVEPELLQKMLDGAIGNLGLADKGAVTRVYEWGSFAYTTYGWGSYAWQLYRDPAMVHMVAKGVMSAGSWAMWLLL